MLKVKFDNELIMNAMGKVEMTMENSMSLTLFPKDAQGNSVCCFAAANASAQVSTHTIYTSKPEVTEPMTLYFGKDFKDTVYALSTFKKDIVIEVEGEKISLRSGAAEVSVSKLDTAASIPSVDPKKEPNCVGFEIKTEEFLTGLRKGGYAHALREVKTDYDDAVCLLPCKDGTILFLSTNMHVIASWKAKTEKRNEKFSEYAENNRNVVLSGNLLNRIFGKMETEMCNFFIFSKQVLIQAGVDFYQIQSMSTKFQMDVSKLVCPSEYGCRFTVNGRDLGKAVEISVLNGKTDHEQNNSRLDINDGKVCVSSVNGKNHLSLDSKTEGNLEIGIRASYLLKALRMLDSKVVITGTNSISPLYLQEEDKEDGLIIIAPVNIGIKAPEPSSPELEDEAETEE